MLDFLTSSDEGAVPLMPLTRAEFAAWLEGRPQVMADWLAASHFTAEPGAIARLPDNNGRLSKVLVGVKAVDDIWSYSDLPRKLAGGVYRIDRDVDPEAATRLALGWALGTYSFRRYREKDESFATLVWPGAAHQPLVTRTVEGVFLARDLINTPASDMGPSDLADAAKTLAKRHKAKLKVISGDHLLAQNYPTIHAVGRASEREPCLIDLRWGKGGDPKVTLVGKGVCFDTGGLDLKPAAGMRLMKKDMGGAANVLGLAHMIMAANLPVRLRVLIPAVENSVSGNAFRPLDVIRTRKGLTVEVGNTDAEGRLVLCDALADADDEKPDLLIDCATLTGAARVALGPDLPAVFTNDDDLALDLMHHGELESDSMWRLPLWEGYRKDLDSDVADLNNVSEGGFAGAITAALYLDAFVGRSTRWAHIDMMAWNPKPRPGRPRGGEAQTIRALYALIAERYGR